jgi:CheY-like chemotaxis protein
MASVQRRRFLIVDNNEQECGAFVQLFESFGHEVSATWSGRDALEYLQSARFDLVLVVPYVADMYVGKFLERVLELPNHPRVAIMKGSRKLEPIKYDKSLGEFQVFDKGQPDQMCQVLRMAFPEFYDGPVN